MRPRDLLGNHPELEPVVNILEGSGIKNFFPTQEQALKLGLLDGKNMVLSVPTASGKTLVAEIAIIKKVFGEGSKALYIVPLRALAAEKYEEFKKYGVLGVKVAISTGDYDSSDPHLGKHDVIITTSEKTDSLLRHSPEWLSRIGIVVLDECHLVNDPHRGPTMEVVATRLKQAVPHAQLLALSATIANTEEIAGWLGATPVSSDWRPVPLKEGVYYDKTIHFCDGTTQKLGNIPKGCSVVASLVLDVLNEGGQALVFVNSRRSAEAEAKRVSTLLEKTRLFGDREKLEKIAEQVESAGRLVYGDKLAYCVRRGVGFHHAGLHQEHRTIVERCFRSNQLRVVVATPTLAAGVNLPARRVIIRDYRRYNPQLGLSPIPVMEYKQMAGRAGRPAYDPRGEAILIANSPDEVEELMERYLLAETERVSSKLGAEQVLRTHVLASIASGFAHSMDSLQNFFEQSLFAKQYGVTGLEKILRSIVDYLVKEDLLNRKGKRLAATQFGVRVSRLYIDPLSGCILRRGIEAAAKSDNGSDFGFLHLACHTPDVTTMYLRRTDYDTTIELLDKVEPEILVKIPDVAVDPEEFEWFLSELKTASLAHMWVNGVEEEEICERFGVGPGDLHRILEAVEWIVYAAYELSKLFKARSLVPKLGKLWLRVKHGVTEELLELVKLRNIGRARAKILYRAGYKTLDDLKKAGPAKLLKIPGFGPELVSSIMEQLGEKGFAVEKRKAKKRAQTLIGDFVE